MRNEKWLERFEDQSAKFKRDPKNPQKIIPAKKRSMVKENVKTKDLKKDNSSENYNKYKNKRGYRNGIYYDSQAEFERHEELKLLEKAGEIKDLRYHHKDDKIMLIDDPVMRYEPDFTYFDLKKNIKVIEDVKGMQTKEFIVKKKIVMNKIRKGEIDALFVLTKKSGKTFKIIETHDKDASYAYKRDGKKRIHK